MTPTVAVLATFARGTIGLTVLFAVSTRLAVAGAADLHFVLASAMVLLELIRLQDGVHIVPTSTWTLAIADAFALRPGTLVPRSPASRAA